jgi:hypothetical protein
MDNVQDLAEARKILIRAADLIRPRGRWTRHVLARDRRGQPVAPTDPRARRWCMAGAVLKAGVDMPARIRYRASASLNSVADQDITTINDTRSKRNVLMLFDRAIAALDKQMARRARR